MTKTARSQSLAILLLRFRDFLEIATLKRHQKESKEKRAVTTNAHSLRTQVEEFEISLLFEISNPE